MQHLATLAIAAGPGAMIGLLALGLIIVYRSSNVLNLAQPAMATVGAYAYLELTAPGRFLAITGVILATIVTGVISVAVYFAVFRPLAMASPLSKLVASVAVLIIIESALLWKYGSEFHATLPLLPTDPIALPGGYFIGTDRLIVIGSAVVITAALWALYKYSKFGTATSALAESPYIGSVYGLRTRRLAVINWFLAGILAGFAGAILAPLTGLNLTQLSSLIIPVLAAALIGSMTSFPLALLGGVLIAYVQAETSIATDIPGAVELVPFVILVVVMTLRGQGIPLRGFTAPRLPAIGSGRIHWLIVAIVVVGFTVSIYTWLPSTLYRSLLTNLAMSIVLLSIVVITGYAGQVSLAQFAFAGLGAYVAAYVASEHGWPFELAALIGVAASAAIGAVVGIPSLRMRGVNLAVITLGFSVVLYSGLLNGTEGLDVAAPTFLGIDLSMITSPRNYLMAAMVALTIAVLVVANLRRSPTGLRMIAVRGNERAASALGINVASTKILAFAIAAGIAGLGGVLLAFQTTSISFIDFAPFASANVLAWATVGGTGYLAGPMVGSMLAPGSLGSELGSAIYDNTAILGLVGGVLLILTLIVHPDGVASLGDGIKHLRSRRHHGRPEVTPKSRALIEQALDGPRRHVPAAQGKSLTVEGISVSFGGVHALSDVSFEVQPGRVHGLIGSNGAGKTTLLDVVSGFAKPSAGRLRLGDTDLGSMPTWRRARLGFGRSFQNVQLLTDLNVLDNLKVACLGDARSAARDLVAPGTIQLTPAAISAIRTLELEQDLFEQVDSLSHGKRQLVSIARALAPSPSFVLLDEPAAGLDDTERRELGNLLRRLAIELNIAILIVEHDVQLVLRVCDWVTVLDRGRVIADGPPSEIRGSARVRDAYLGEHQSTETESDTPASVTR